MRTDDVINEIEKVVRGKRQVITMVVATLLAGGHVLLEDIPGVGKTTLAVALSRALGLDFSRVQFTPDVVPGDLLGFTYYDQKTGEFIFREGSIYTNLFLADEINRTSPKTQSALLEVMEERHATVEGRTRQLPDPFFVIATENPYGSSGTQKLPESQLDRFMTCMTMGYPDHASEVEVLMNDSHSRLDQVQPVFTAGEIADIRKQIENLHADPTLYDYIVALSEKTRTDERFSLGLSPRGSIALFKVSRALAYMSGRTFLAPEDIHAAWMNVAAHRVRLSPRGRATGLSCEEVLSEIIRSVPIPKIS
ncbi:MAG: MoxR family ATPase [Lachnospiraceae bacterium]|nr:MoxR family ATPase [Lachnospiraceae bacterium]